MVSLENRNTDEPFEFTFPKAVWESFSSLRKGFGCEYLTTNITKMSLHKISLFKYLDDAVRVTMIASSLAEVPVDQPDHIKIEGIRDGVQDPIVSEPTDSLVQVSITNDIVPYSAISTAVTGDVDTGDLVGHDEPSEQEKDCETLEHVMDELSHNASHLKDGVAVECERILTLDKITHKIVSVKEALEAMGQMSQSEDEQQDSCHAITEEDDDLAFQNSHADSLNLEEETQVMSHMPRDTLQHDTVVQSPGTEGSEQRRTNSEKALDNVCPLCTRHYQSKHHVLQHIRKEHNDQPEEVKLELIKKIKVEVKEQCGICGKFYGNALILRVHMDEMHTPHVHAKCPTCGITVKNEKSLAGHIKRIHGEDERKYLCHLCPASFRVQNYLNGHLKAVHAGIPKDTFSCDACDFKSSLEKYVRLHKSRVHGEKKFQCPSCKRKFSSGSNLKRHIEHVHSPAKLPRYSCRNCTKTFSTSGNLKNHADKAHKGVPYLCRDCGVLFRQELDLETHSHDGTCKAAGVFQSALEKYILFD